MKNASEMSGDNYTMSLDGIQNETQFGEGEGAISCEICTLVNSPYSSDLQAFAEELLRKPTEVSCTIAIA